MENNGKKGKSLNSWLMTFTLVVAFSVVLCWPDEQQTKINNPDKLAELSSTKKLEKTCASHDVRAADNAFSKPKDLVILDDIPEGRLKKDLTHLSPESLKRAFTTFAQLGKQVVVNDVASLNVDENGDVFYTCGNHQHLLTQSGTGSVITDTELAASAASIDEIPEINNLPGTPVHISTPPVLHSLSGSKNVIYLDFNGGSVKGTAWNANYSVTEWDCKPYGNDSDDAFFSPKEQIQITEIWKRVSEMFAPFNVDVTTEEPVSVTKTTAWVMITEGTDKSDVPCPHESDGGLAYVGHFGKESNLTHGMTWVKDYSTRPYSAYVIAHEVGHNFGLGHDGFEDPVNSISEGYYSGHHDSIYTWGPIMGAPILPPIYATSTNKTYTADIIQWCKGEYYGANNTQDDLQIIQSKLGFKVDDHSNGAIDSTVITILSGSTAEASGIIERIGDIDFFELNVPKGGLIISGKPFQVSKTNFQVTSGIGAGLDVEMKLYSSTGDLVAASNVLDSINAAFEVGLDAGKYYLKISPTASGSPLDSTPTGYTLYGALGSYALSFEQIPTQTVTFSSGDYGLVADASRSLVVEYGASATSPYVESNAGYVFTGWDRELTSIVDDITTTALYAEKGAIVFSSANPGADDRWSVYPQPGKSWEAFGENGSGILRNQILTSSSDNCDISFDGTFEDGTISFRAKRDSIWSSMEFYIDGVKQTFDVGIGRDWKGPFTFPISSGVHNITWRCVMGHRDHVWLRDIIFPLADHYSITFMNNHNGELSGPLMQNISNGENLSPVQASAYDGYSFSMWSDGVKDNPRLLSTGIEATLFPVYVRSDEYEQTIELKKGRNLVALTVVPADNAFESLLDSNMEKLVYVKDQRGYFLRKTQDKWHGAVRSWNWDEGYELFVNDDVTLKVRGKQIATPSLIECRKGYSFVPIFGDSSIPVNQIADELSSSFQFIKNFSGSGYVSGAINNELISLESGQSYLLKLSEERVLSIP